MGVSDNDIAFIHIQLNELKTRVSKLEGAKGKPGAGTCMCKMSPEDREKSCASTGTTWEAESTTRFPVSALVDHRCPKHGEKAQPALWGRHKDKELHVTYAEWASLGVTWESES